MEADDISNLSTRVFVVALLRFLCYLLEKSTVSQLSLFSKFKGINVKDNTINSSTMSMALHVLGALLAVANAESVYFWYFDNTCFEGTPWETEYRIGECFSTENNYGDYEYGLAQWIVEGETVQLSFHGQRPCLL